MCGGGAEGFIVGRHVCDNVVDMGVEARVASMKATPSDLPCILAWDVGAAFPSFSHAWLFSSYGIGSVPRWFS